jgi:hypothetical protein
MDRTPGHPEGLGRPRVCQGPHLSWRSLLVRCDRASRGTCSGTSQHEERVAYLGNPLFLCLKESNAGRCVLRCGHYTSEGAASLPGMNL